jgi:hypothetical protein
MPEFILNKPRDRKPPHPYFELSTFAQGYVEAMFFTNGDTGDERENLLNDWGVERLTKEACADIAKDCEAFWTANETDLKAAMELEPGSESFRYARYELDETRLGHLFWYSRQGHGVGFDDDGNADCLNRLQEAGRAFPEAYIEAYRGWIYHR